MTNCVRRKKSGWKGHSWKKIIMNEIHVGRECTACPKKVYNPRIKLVKK